MSNKEKFYDNKYWQSGTGQSLWNVRKLQAFIQAITTPDIPAPFFTVGSNEMTDEWNGTWYAEWMTKNAENPSHYHTLNIEAEGTDFIVFAMKPHEDKKEPIAETDAFDFWYLFSSDKNRKDSDSKDKYNDWSELEDAIQSAKNWLELHKNELSTHSLKNTFGL